ncbi:hypothetical protein [Pseudomonas guariconensis]|uniref:hypothetical protein n=1 Tax=Pseudomonas guariconensis TaxID=1288410 RepID=UPI002FE65B29
MPAAFTAWTETGVVQIDSNMKTISPSFRRTYTGPYTNDGNTMYIGTWYEFTITVPAGINYLFFGSPVDRTIGLTKKSGTSHTFRTTAQGTIEIYGFREAPVQASNKPGLQLFDEAGNLTFDSNSRFMQVTNAFTVPTTGMKVEPWLVPGRKYAVGLGVYPKCWRGALNAGLPWGIVMSYCVRVGPTSGGGGHTAIISRPMGGGGDPTPPDTPQASPPTAMIVDVTGL